MGTNYNLHITVAFPTIPNSNALFLEPWSTNERRGGFPDGSGPFLQSLTVPYQILIESII